MMEYETILRDYLKAIENYHKSGIVKEHSYHSALQRQFPRLVPGITAIDEPKRVVCGTPDYVVLRSSGGNPFTTNYKDAPEQERVFINKTQYFEGVPSEVWNFYVDGYQVYQKWLKDRKGRTLSFEDIQHYRRVVAALAETITLMEAVDEAIEEHGGRPMETEILAKHILHTK